jgi:hypothetical protein
MTLRELIEQQKDTSLRPRPGESSQDTLNRVVKALDNPQTDEQVLGRLLAEHFRWDGGAILRTAVSALIDANFHTEAAAVGVISATTENHDEGPEPDGTRYLGGGLHGSTSR